MGYTISIPYKESSDFSTTGNANFTGTSLELAKEDKLISKPGDLTNPTDPNMEYDGQLQSKNIFGVDNELACVWTSVVTENFSSVLPAIKNNTASIVDNYISMDAATVSFENDLFVGKQIFHHEFDIKNHLSMSPTTYVILATQYTLNVGNDNYFHIKVKSQGIQLLVKTGATSFALETPLPDGNAGTTYNIAATFVNKQGATDGVLRLYIDGVPSTPVAITEEVDTSIFNSMYFPTNSRVRFKNYRYENTDKYAGSSFTPETTLPELPFVESHTEVLNESYAEVGTVQSFAGLTVGNSSGAKYSVNNLWWNGSAWTASDNSYSQSSTLADINANAGTLPVTDNYFLSVALANGSTRNYIDSVDFAFNGQKYSDAISATFNSSFPASAFNDFEAFLSLPSSYSSVTFAFLVGSTLYWHNGSSWVESNGSVAESNTLAQVKASIETLDQTGLFKLVTFLESNDEPSGFQNLTSPSITLSVVDITFEIPGLELPNECLVYGLDRDTCTDPVVNGTYENEGDVEYSIVFENEKTFTHKSAIIRKSVCEIVTTGAFAVLAKELYETETKKDTPVAGDVYMYLVKMRKKTKISLRGSLTDKIEDDVLGYCEIPNLNEVLFTDLVFTDTKPTNSI